MIRRAIRCWRTVLCAHGVLLVFAILLSFPAWGVARDAVGARPEGDLALWREGGVFLADMLARSGTAIRQAVRATALGAVVFALLALPLSAGLFATLREGRDLGAGRFASSAAGRAGAFLVVWLLFLVGAALVGGVGGVAARWIVKAFAETPDPRRGLFLAGLAMLPVGGLLLLLASATDVARSALAGGRSGPVRTLLRAFGAALRRPLVFGSPYAAFGMAALAATLVAAALANHLGGRPGAPAVVLLLVGQATLVLRAFLRAAWMGAAARLADAYLPASTSAGGVSA